MASSSKEPEVLCRECRVSFQSHAAYAAHCKRKMKEGKGHIHCEICGAEFVRRETLTRHHNQEHAHEQDLDCPGCSLHFTRLGSLMSHIESGKCLKIGKGDIDEGRFRLSKVGRTLAVLDGKDPKEYYGRYLPVDESAIDGPLSSLGANRKFMGHMIQYDGPDGAAPSTISVKGRHEGSNVSVQVKHLGGQRSRGPDIRPGSVTAAEFPTPSEAGASKKQTGVQGHKASFPDASVEGRASGSSGLRGAAQSIQAQTASVPGLRPGSLVDAEFPTLAEAAASKKNAGSQTQKAELSDSAAIRVPEARILPGADKTKHSPGSLVAAGSPTLAEAGVIKGHTDHEVNKVGVLDSPAVGKDQPLMARVKTFADSRWAPKATTAVSSRPSHSCGLDLLGDDTPKFDVKLGQASNINSPPKTSEATKTSLHEYQNQQRNPLLSDAQQSPSKKRGGDAGQSPVSRGQLVHTREASVNTTGTSGISSSGFDKYATDDTKISIPPHLRSKISRGGATDCSQTSKKSVDDQLTQRASLHMHGKPGIGLTADCAEAPEEDDGDTVKRSDHGTIGSTVVTARTSSDLPPHLRGNIQEDPEGSDDGSTENILSVLEAIPNHSGGLHRAATASIAGTYTSAIPASDVPAGRSVVDGGYSDSEFDLTEPLHARERSNNGNASLPPHLRGNLGQPVRTLSKVTETEDSCTLSVLTSQSSLKLAGSGDQPASDRPSQLRDNFGVAPTIKSYAVVAKTSESLPPHLRQRQGGSIVIPTGQDVFGNNTAEAAETPPHQMDQVSTEGGSSSLGLQNESSNATVPRTQIGVRMRDDDEDSGLGCHDPEHPRYNPQSYYCQLTKKYQCPIGTCAKLLKSPQAITGHLSSDAHKRPHMNLQCPHCLKYFKSTAALTQHAESQGRKCAIRDTTEYRPFVDQLTGGIADLEGVHEDMTNKYVVTRWAMDEYGDEEGFERAVGALERQRRREIGEKEGGGYWTGKTIEW